MSAHDLSDVQIADARCLWGEGHTLGEVAEAISCSVYDLSPWLYMEDPAMQAKIAGRSAES